MKQPFWYRAGMLMSLLVGIGVSATLWHAFGWGPNSIVMLLFALAIGAVFWALSRPIFFMASAAWRVCRSPHRREFKTAWRRLACDARLEDDGTLRMLWLRPSSRRPAPFYDWLRFEWMLDNMQAGIPAREWLSSCSRLRSRTGYYKNGKTDPTSASCAMLWRRSDWFWGGT